MKKHEIIYPRLFENVLKYKIKTFGAVVIEGPKQICKSDLDIKYDKSVYDLTKRPNVVDLEIKKSVSGLKPRLIKEWAIDQMSAPEFMTIIVVGNKINQPYQRSDGIYVIPHACLGI